MDGRTKTGRLKKLQNSADHVQIGKFLINEKKFFSRLVEDDNGCQNWTGGMHRQGYGMASIYDTSKQNRVMNVAHRVAMMLHLGRELTRDEFIVHEFCDSQTCCNPEHMIVGTAHDRNRVQYQKGRRHEQKIKKQNRNYKYPDEMMRFIRDNPVEASMKKYNLKRSQLWFLKERFTKGYKWL